MTNALLTLVIPTYNRPNMLEKAIHSALQDHDERLCCLVVDDASPRETEQTVARLQEQYGASLCYIRHQHNKGETGAINTGWQTVTTPYFAVLSDDDLLCTGWADAMLQALATHPHAIVAYPDWAVIDEQDQTLETRLLSQYDATSFYRSFQCTPGAGAVINKAALSCEALRNTDYRYTPDLLMWLELATKGDFVHVPGVYALWRKHTGSITQSAEAKQHTNRKIDEMQRMIAFFIDQYRNHPHITTHGHHLKLRTKLQVARLLAASKQYGRSFFWLFSVFICAPIWTIRHLWGYMRLKLRVYG